MTRSTRIPADLARRFAERRGREETPDQEIARRETFRLPRDQARSTAREWFDRYPETAYRTRVESWRVLDNGLIEFTMSRLTTAE